MQRGNSCFPLLSVRVLYAHVSCHGQPLIHYGISLLIMLVSVYVCEVTHCLHRLLALLSYCCSCLHKGWLAACWDSREKLACVCMSSSEGRSLSSSGCCITIQDLGSWSLFTSQGLHGLNFLNCAQSQNTGKTGACFLCLIVYLSPMPPFISLHHGFFKIVNQYLLAFRLTVHCKILAKPYPSNNTQLGSRFSRTSIHPLQYHLLLLPRDLGSSYPLLVVILSYLSKKWFYSAILQHLPYNNTPCSLLIFQTCSLRQNSESFQLYSQNHNLNVLSAQ